MNCINPGGRYLLKISEDPQIKAQIVDRIMSNDVSSSTPCQWKAPWPFWQQSGAGIRTGVFYEQVEMIEVYLPWLHVKCSDQAESSPSNGGGATVSRDWPGPMNRTRLMSSPQIYKPQAKSQVGKAKSSTQGNPTSEKHPPTKFRALDWKDLECGRHLYAKKHSKLKHRRWIAQTDSIICISTPTLG